MLVCGRLAECSSSWTLERLLGVAPAQRLRL